MSAPAPPDEVQKAIELLESVVADRTRLMQLSEQQRIALLAAAGKVSQPERTAQSRLTKAVRKSRRETKRHTDRAARASSEIRTLRQAPVFVAPLTARLPEGTKTEARVLQNPRHCYVCKQEYLKLHFFYDSMCIACGDFNYAKRFPKADLRGKVALITGGRVKIGYQASLMLLRSGAEVIATTRFPNDASLRYAREADFAEWSHRIHIHGLDLRHAPSVELFALHIARTHAKLDILINNAAQTVRRPPGWYGHLLPTEQLRPHELPASSRPLLEDHLACVSALHPSQRDALAPSWRSDDPALGIHASAGLSMVPYAFEHGDEYKHCFPEGKVDADLQQVDLRPVNSWRLSLAEVDMAEMLEVHLVNAVAPFILCSKLKGLMLNDRREPGHIVNVSAMEGSFSRGTKTDKHPHTNMAKAALNMLTLTSAPDYAKSNIFMNAVDTGWVTDEDPAQHAHRKVTELDFHPPLDIVDGAARVVDPVFVAVTTAQCCFGNFFKDYRPTSW